jgi:hypothetical protein
MVKDSGPELDAAQTANPQAEEMMIVWVRDAKLGILTDL